MWTHSQTYLVTLFFLSVQLWDFCFYMTGRLWMIWSEWKRKMGWDWDVVLWLKSNLGWEIMDTRPHHSKQNPLVHPFHRLHWISRSCCVGSWPVCADVCLSCPAHQCGCSGCAGASMLCAWRNTFCGWVSYVLHCKGRVILVVCISISYLWNFYYWNQKHANAHQRATLAQPK